MLARTSRRGYTLFELIVVLAVLVVLVTITIPALRSFRGDSRQRAAADAIRGEVALARARAKEEGRPYRIAVSDDGKRIRRAPDDDGFAQAAASDCPDGSAAVDYPFDGVTASVVPEEDSAPASDGNWTTLATVMPDGTCREVTTLVAIKEEDGTALHLRIRGVTAACRVVPGPAGAKGGAK
jgi:prepilin-type N-terminal cleavage/methylation domain-containing protein